MAGIAFAVLRERANRTLQDPGDAAYYLGIPELGVIPVGTHANPGAAAWSCGLAARAASRQGRGGSRVHGESADRIEMVSWRKKTSLLAESYRTTLTSILFARRGGERPRLLVFTSASPKEGKTTTVCNLGIALAEMNQSVLLIDGDMRKPRLHAVFDVPNSHGLSDLLLEGRRWMPTRSKRRAWRLRFPACTCCRREDRGAAPRACCIPPGCPNCSGCCGRSSTRC